MFEFERDYKSVVEHAAKYQKENRVLREILADEITRRMHVEENLKQTAEQLKEYNNMYHEILVELDKASRKEELVKSLKSILCKN